MANLDDALGWLHLFGDATRVRLLAVLAEHELTVAELTGVTDLAQSRVSTHLGKLREAGVLRDRKVGVQTFYSVNGGMSEEARKVWALLSAQLRDPILDSDRERAAALLRSREAAWPDQVAGQMERHYSPGRTWDATIRGFLGLMRLGDVLDAGSGDGAIAQLLALRARSVTCLDRSERVIEAAKKRLGRLPNLRFVVGDLHAMDFPAQTFDQVLLFNVLTYAHDPPMVLREAARVLRPGATLVLVTLEAHQHLDVTSAYQHVQPGFSVAAVRSMLSQAGLEVEHCEVTVRERRQPYFQVITAYANKP